MTQKKPAQETMTTIKRIIKKPEIEKTFDKMDLKTKIVIYLVGIVITFVFIIGFLLGVLIS